MQLKVKFPQAAITNIKNLPPVFPKMFRTSVWRETRDGCLWHYVCKTINVCSRKVALTIFTEMCSVSSFREIKMLSSSKKINGNWQRKYIAGNLCIMKANGGYRQKAILLKNIYLYNLWYLVALKTLNTRDEALYFK